MRIARRKGKKTMRVPYLWGSCVFLFFSSFAVFPSAAFEVDGFKNGMTKAEVTERLKSLQKFDMTKEEKNALLVWDKPGKSNRGYSFSICNDKLVQLQTELAPSARNFIVVAGKFRRELARPLDVQVLGPAIVSTGEFSHIEIVWSKGEETVNLQYSVFGPEKMFPTNDQLSIVYKVPNSCFAVPQ